MISPRQSSDDRSKYIRIELAIMVCLCLLPALWSTIISQLHLQFATGRSQVSHYVIWIGIYVGRALAAAFIVWLSGDDLRDFGTRWIRFRVTFLLMVFALFLMVAIVFAGGYLQANSSTQVFRSIQQQDFSFRVAYSIYYFLYTGLTAWFAFGYLPKRLQELLKDQIFSPAVLATTVYVLMATRAPRDLLPELVLGLYWAFSSIFVKSVWPILLILAISSVGLLFSHPT